FYARIGSEQDEFTFEDLVEGVCEKLVSRHPHIYGEAALETEEAVKQNWERIKMKEGKTSVSAGVPQSMPAVTKARAWQETTKKGGVEWKDKEVGSDKVEEEWREVHQALHHGSKDELESEIGDVVFALINYPRFLNLDPELALEKTNQKFLSRFQAMEEMA